MEKQKVSKERKQKSLRVGKKIKKIKATTVIDKDIKQNFFPIPSEAEG